MSKKSEDGYELDDQGRKIYPSYAGYVPPDASPLSNHQVRPPWAPEYASYYDEDKPPAGWSRNADGEWVNEEDEPEPQPQMEEEGPTEPVGALAAPTGETCEKCEKEFKNTRALRMHARRCA